MYFEKSLGIFMGAFVVWGFLMALSFNLILMAFGVKKDPRLIWVSFVMAISYLISDHFFDFFSGPELYKVWFIYDLITLSFILPILFFSKSQKLTAGCLYAIIGLLVNSALLISMHYDIVVRQNYDSWWLWSAYSIGINLSDLIMIVALIVDRDILGLAWLKDKAKERLSMLSNRLFHRCSTMTFQ